jgi:hypothetical protein
MVRKFRRPVFIEQAHARVGRHVVDVEVVCLFLAAVALVQVDPDSSPLGADRVRSRTPARSKRGIGGSLTIPSSAQRYAFARALSYVKKPQALPSCDPKHCHRVSSPRHGCPTTGSEIRPNPGRSSPISRTRSRSWLLAIPDAITSSTLFFAVSCSSADLDDPRLVLTPFQRWPWPSPPSPAVAKLVTQSDRRTPTLSKSILAPRRQAACWRWSLSTDRCRS